MKVLKKSVTKLNDQIAKITALIACQLGQASFIINQIRDLANDSYRKASESIYKQLLNELAAQLDKLFVPLGVFFNADEKKQAISSVQEASGFGMLAIQN